MKRNPVINGLVASLLLSGIYFLFLLLIGGTEHAFGFILSLWYWLAIIITGFGVQIALYTYIRQSIKSREATAEITASAGGGHHRRGILVFPRLGKNIQKLTLQLAPGAKFKDLNFEWIIE